MEQIFLGLLLNDIDDVVDRDHTDQPVLQVDHRNRQQIVFGDDLGNLFRFRFDLAAHHALHHGVAKMSERIGEDQASQREHAVEMAFAVGAIDVEERILARVLADCLDGLPDSQVLIEREVLRGHQRAGRFFLSFEKRLQLCALGRAEKFKNTLAAIVVERVEQIGGVIRSR